MFKFKMRIPAYYSIAQVADILGTSKETLRRWDKNGKLVPKRHPKNKYRVYHRSQLEQFEQAQLLFNSNWDVEVGIKPDRSYTSYAWIVRANIAKLALFALKIA